MRYSTLWIKSVSILLLFSYTSSGNWMRGETNGDGHRIGVTTYALHLLPCARGEYLPPHDLSSTGSQANSGSRPVPANRPQQFFPSQPSMPSSFTLSTPVHRARTTSHSLPPMSGRHNFDMDHSTVQEKVHVPRRAASMPNLTSPTPTPIQVEEEAALRPAPLIIRKPVPPPKHPGRNARPLEPYDNSRTKELPALPVLETQAGEHETDLAKPMGSVKEARMRAEAILAASKKRDMQQSTASSSSTPLPPNSVASESGQGTPRSSHDDAPRPVTNSSHRTPAALRQRHSEAA